MKALEKVRFKKKTEKITPSLAEVNKVHSMIGKNNQGNHNALKRKLNLLGGSGDIEDCSDGGSEESRGLGNGGDGALGLSGPNGSTKPTNEDEENLTPLERLHALQRRQLEVNGFVNNAGGEMPSKKKMGSCCGGGGDGGGDTAITNIRRGTGGSSLDGGQGESGRSTNLDQYGDMSKTPVVFVSANDSIQIGMKIDGITCSSCIKIIEKVLTRGKPPISGILDAVADQELKAAIIKIDKSSNAKRIAHEAVNRLSMVGYDGDPFEMDIANLNPSVTEKIGARMDVNVLSAAFDVVASTSDIEDIIDWNKECTCGDTISRETCERRSQLNNHVLDAFEERATKVSEYIVGCPSKYGLDCSCGVNCKCDKDSCNCNKPKSGNLNNVMNNKGMFGNSLGVGVGGGAGGGVFPLEEPHPGAGPNNPFLAMNSGVTPHMGNGVVGAGGVGGVGGVGPGMQNAHLLEQQLQLQQLALVNSMNNQRLLALQSEQAQQATLSGILGGPGVSNAGAGVVPGGGAAPGNFMVPNGFPNGFPGVGGMMPPNNGNPSTNANAAIQNPHGIGNPHHPFGPAWPDNSGSMNMAGIVSSMENFGNQPSHGVGSSNGPANFFNGPDWEGMDEMNGDRR